MIVKQLVVGVLPTLNIKLIEKLTAPPKEDNDYEVVDEEIKKLEYDPYVKQLLDEIKIRLHYAMSPECENVPALLYAAWDRVLILAKLANDYLINLDALIGIGSLEAALKEANKELSKTKKSLKQSKTANKLNKIAKVDDIEDLQTLVEFAGKKFAEALAKYREMSENTKLASRTIQRASHAVDFVLYRTLRLKRD